MSSIRKQLTLWICSGLLFLWVGAGVGIYLSAHQGLLNQIDRELSLDTKITRALSRGFGEHNANSRNHPRAPRNQIDQPEYEDDQSGHFFQTWNAEKETTTKSTNLGDSELPFPEGATTEEAFHTQTWIDGKQLRVLTYRSYPEENARGHDARTRRNPHVYICIARDLAELQAPLSSLLGGIIAIGLIAIAATILLVSLALRRGLAPLRLLAEQTSEVDENSLATRFDASNAPTELQPIYQRLNELVQRLESGFERERRFSSNLAHEIRTPVAELRMLTEVALQWPDQSDPKTHAECLEIALQLERMVDNLFALARMESGEIESKSEPVDLAALVEKLRKPYVQASEEKRLQVSLDFPANSTWQSDPDLLHHLLGNLLSNAVEYTPEEGEIRLNATEDTLTIANTPHSLEENDLEHLFQRFWRQDKARQDSTHAGLGLSLAATCAQALKLSLRASIEDQWLVFTVKKLPEA